MNAKAEVFLDTCPLDEFYGARGGTPPSIDRIAPEEMPEPYRSLLVHKTDMTSTLERFYGDTLHVEVLGRHTRENEYCREVALVLNGTKKRVEFGAIKIRLGLFPPAAQQEILREHEPLGRILNLVHLPFVSRPGAFLRLASDNFIDSALQLRGPQVLYGRRNSLFDAQERPLAEIIEILPP